MTWIRDLHLPRWILHAGLSACVFAMGFLLSEIRANHNGREEERDRVTKIVVPGHETRIVVLELRAAAQEGISKRIDDRVEKMDVKLDGLKAGQSRQETTMARLETKLNRINQ